MIENLLSDLQERYEGAFHFQQGKHSYYLEHNKNGLIIRCADNAVQVFKNDKCMVYENNIPHDRIIAVCGNYLKHRHVQTTLW